MFRSFCLSDITFAAGFRSVCQFNDVMKKRFGRSPREIRKLNNSLQGQPLRVSYPFTFSFDDFLKHIKKQNKTSKQVVTNNVYMDTFNYQDVDIGFALSCDVGAEYLELTIHSDNLQCYLPMYNRVRRMLDIFISKQQD